MSGYVIRNRSPRAFYTGRAGEAWVSADPREAFAFASYGEAERKALLFNRRTALTGLHFAVVPAADV